jgi:hypothetical protein
MQSQGRRYRATGCSLRQSTYCWLPKRQIQTGVTDGTGTNSNARKCHVSVARNCQRLQLTWPAQKQRIDRRMGRETVFCATQRTN